MNIAVASLPLDPAARALPVAGAVQRHWLARAGAAVWRALEEGGRARAHQHLLDFADQCEALQPNLAKELRAASRHGPLA